MRILRVGLVAVVGLGALGIDLDESVRTRAISDGSAHAKRHHRRHHKSRKRHRKHHRRTAPPPTEM